MIDKMNTEMKEESKNSKNAKGSNDTGLSIETLKQMGYNYPCTARRIIEAVEQGEDPKKTCSGLIKSYLITEGNGHLFHLFILSYTYWDWIDKSHGYVSSQKEDKDCILLIDRKWVPSNNEKLLGEVFEAIRDGKTVEEALEYLKEEEAEQPATVYTIESLKEMGFHYPELALKVIDFIDHSTSVEGVKDLKVENGKTGERSCINSYYVEETEVYRWKVLRVYLTAPDFPFSFADTGEDVEDYKADCLCFLNYELIPTANEDDQFGVIWDTDIENMPLEKALEIHLKKDKSPANSEKEAPAPESNDTEGEKIRVSTDISTDEIEVETNNAAACDDTAKAKDSDKEEATEKSMAAIEKKSIEALKAANEMGKDWWTQPIDDMEFTKKEFERAKAKQVAKSEAPCDLQCAVSFCKDIFEEKCGLYGLSFSEMHLETLTDQLFMKATILKRRLTDRDKSKRLGEAFFEGIRDEFAAVVNYGVIALWQGGFGVLQSLVPEAPIKFYMDQMKAALSLISDKGADYGELWRKQRIGTLADMIYTKVRRLKGIEDQYRFGSMTKENYHKFAGDQYRDLINYGLFGVVRMTEIADVMAFEMEEDETDEEEGYE